MANNSITTGLINARINYKKYSSIKNKIETSIDNGRYEIENWNRID